MAQFDFDLFTIGAGSGGVRASRMAASYGARVAVAEESRLGGTCVNVGCIPKKLLVYASHFAEDFADAAAYGWSVAPPSFDWATLIANKDKEIARLNGIYQNILESNGVSIIHGHARVVDAHTVEVGGERYSAAHILLATGSAPVMPGGLGGELAISSNEVFHLAEQPQRIVIVGGGYIAVEFAGILHGLGSAVTQVYRGPLFLRGFDDDVREVLADEMRKKGLDLRFDTTVEKIEQVAGGLKVTLNDATTLEVDQVLCAIGRRPLLQNLGLDEAGVVVDERGAVVVDEYNRTNVPSIHAIGDITDRIQLTPVAIHEGMALAATLFDGRPTAIDHVDVPSAVFSQPSIASVGCTEAQARERHGELEIFRSRFRALKQTLTGSDETMMMKLIVAAEGRRVVGLHVVGPDAGEIVQGFAVAVKAGLTKEQFDATIGIHPTAAEELVTMREPVQ
ncbi:MAG: glutathione-disulfide reductase [Deltaproteobacteria bacterium]